MIIGVVVGTFDMFHTGHLNLLLKAHKKCDYLIVGINKDNVVLRDKNKEPIIHEKDRLKIVNSIFCVNETKLVKTNAALFIQSLIKNGKKIDYYFRGNEPDKKYIKNENKIIKSLGIKIIQFKYTSNISSSLLREKLLNAF